ncbi:MAG: HEAT repeat domain-containing protein [Anaerolineae bacterium]|jgi:HEAT repeat protein|nr:HEAT repeat domain-containing protein [Anaerolineae bacterium]
MGVKDEIRPLHPGFNYVLAILSQFSGGQRVPDAVVRGLSQLLPSQVANVQVVWATLPVEVRHEVMEALTTAAESDFELDYTAFGIMALEDGAAVVRQAAVELLIELVDADHTARLLAVAQHDESDEVRAAAIKALGPILLEAELGKLSESMALPVIEYLLDVLEDERGDLEVRARALEAVAHSSHDAVPGQIDRAYRSGDTRMKTAALFAMGASSDEIWGEIVIQELTARRPEHRYEAARAAGELMVSEAVRPLSRLALEDEGQVRNAAVWALGEIGGKEAIRVLEAMLEQADEDEDDALVDLLEDAIDSATVADGQVYGFDSEFDQ